MQLTYSFCDMLAAERLVEQKVQHSAPTQCSAGLGGCAGGIQSLVLISGDVCRHTASEWSTERRGDKM